MKPQTKLTRTQRRLQRRLARYADPASPALARFLEVRDHSLLDIARGLERIAVELLTHPGHVGLAGGGYVYYPTDATLTRWRATDDSDVKADLLTVVLEHAGTLAADLARREIEQTLDLLGRLAAPEAQWHAKHALARLADAAQVALLYALTETGGERYSKLAELYAARFLAGENYPDWALQEEQIWRLI